MDQNEQLETLRLRLQELIQEWRAYRYTGYVPPEDGAAANYSEEAVHDCADRLEELIGRME